MKIYLCNMEPADRRYCMAQFRAPPYAFELAEGEPAAALMKERGDDAMRIGLDEDAGGLDFGDAVSNDRNLLILRKPCAKQILARFELGDHEVLPVVLVNAKGRIHAKDYVVLNPFGMVDCLDMERSEMDGDEEDPCVRIFGKYWLDASRVPTDRDVFRVRCLVSGYMLSERLATFIHEQGFTNFVLRQVQLS